jgi:hypothetical protein
VNLDNPIGLFQLRMPVTRVRIMRQGSQKLAWAPSLASPGRLHSMIS